MVHLLGDHNRPIVERYAGEFETEGGQTILECWSMEPHDAAIAFRNFFSVGHPDVLPLLDRSRLESHHSDDSSSRMWWQAKTVWTGDYIEMALRPDTRITIGETVIAYRGHSYWTWSKAFISQMKTLTASNRLSLRNHAIQDRMFDEINQRYKGRDA